MLLSVFNFKMFVDSKYKLCYNKCKITINLMGGYEDSIMNSMKKFVSVSVEELDDEFLAGVLGGVRDHDCYYGGNDNDSIQRTIDNKCEIVVKCFEAGAYGAGIMASVGCLIACGVYYHKAKVAKDTSDAKEYKIKADKCTSAGIMLLAPLLIFKIFYNL